MQVRWDCDSMPRMLRNAPLLRRGALLIRGRNDGSIQYGPGSAERHEECRTAP
jgi:hypothetical protein